MKVLLQIHIKPLIKANIDYLVLGCTHYPYLIPQLIDMLPKHIKIIDSGEAVAIQTKTILEKHNLINTRTTHSKSVFYTNANNIELMNSLLGEKYKVEYLDF